MVLGPDEAWTTGRTELVQGLKMFETPDLPLAANKNWTNCWEVKPKYNESIRLMMRQA